MSGRPTEVGMQSSSVNSALCERSAKNRPQAIGIYSLNVPRAVGKALAQHAGQNFADTIVESKVFRRCADHYVLLAYACAYHTLDA